MAQGFAGFWICFVLLWNNRCVMGCRGQVLMSRVLFYHGTIWNNTWNNMKCNEIKGLRGVFPLLFYCSIKIIISIPTRDPFLHLPKKSNE